MLRFFLLIFLAALTACGASDDTTPLTDSGGDTEPEVTSSTGFIECASDTDCGDGLFCAIECFQGPCGADDAVSAQTVGQYCQPCEECVADSDAVDGSCATCVTE